MPNLNIKKNIILASISPRRIELLKQWGLKFKVVPSSVNEKTNLKKPSAIVKHLAFQKACDVKRKFTNACVIGADTIVVLNKKILGKPKNKKHSEKILEELNGSLHKVYTGVCVINDSKKTVFYDVACVRMKKLPSKQLKKLFGKHMDKAGAYAVQDTDDAFVKKIYGDYYTVVGLPHIKLKKEFKKFNIKIK